MPNIPNFLADTQSIKQKVDKISKWYTTKYFNVHRKLLLSVLFIVTQEAMRMRSDDAAKE